MILCRENPKDSTETNKTELLEVNKFSEVVGYRVNTPKSVMILYTTNEISNERNLRKSHLHEDQKE